MKKIILFSMLVILSGCDAGGQIKNPDEVIENIQKCQSIGSKVINYSRLNDVSPIRITCGGLTK